MSVRIIIKNNNKLSNELKKLNKDLQHEIYDTLYAMSKAEIETVAKRNVPVDSGRLRASINTMTENVDTFNYTDRNGNSFDGMLKTVRAKKGQIFVGTNVEYAEKIHERGGGGPNSRRTSGGQKKPKGYGRHFLRKAYMQAVPKMIIELKRIRGVE
jgi:hypothetical protein